MSQISDRTARLLKASVERLAGGKDVAVAFSGGIDSGLIAGLAIGCARRAVLYTAGLEGSHDIQSAESAAEMLGGDLRVIALDDGAVLASIEGQMRITGTVSPLVLAFETPLYNVLRTCSEDTVLGGQGADEQFAGYRKYVGMEEARLRESMSEDLRRFYSQTEPHEMRMAEHFGKTVCYPYLDREVSALAASAPVEEFLPSDPGIRKKVLCDAAVSLGFGFLAERPKKAAQYGSGTMDAVRRICRERGTTYNALVSNIAGSLCTSGDPR